jgi:GGDEF domain-containing protein
LNNASLSSEIECPARLPHYTQPLDRLTISIGVSSFQENTASFEELIKMADDALKIILSPFPRHPADRAKPGGSVRFGFE